MTDNTIANQIADVWKAEQEILDVFHGICQRNNLTYSLAYGTLIGAIRHKGFIPWDDDIDVMMPRDDYNKFLALWEKEKPDGYLLQNHGNTPAFTQSFTKIRKNNTSFIQSEEEKNAGYHTGIFIDIFPVDRVPEKTIQRKLQFFASMVNMLFTRNYPSGSGGIIGFGEKILLKASNKTKAKWIEKTNKYIQKQSFSKMGDFVISDTLFDARIYFPSTLFDKIETTAFNEKDYCIVSDYNTYLTKQYGDYMQLPPEEERVWKHHPIFISFTHNYEELRDE